MTATTAHAPASAPVSSATLEPLPDGAVVPALTNQIAAVHVALQAEGGPIRVGLVVNGEPLPEDVSETVTAGDRRSVFFRIDGLDAGVNEFAIACAGEGAVRNVEMTVLA